MKYFSRAWRQLRVYFRKKIILFLDFDGTLAPIANTPQQASIAPSLMTILQRLARQSQCQIVIISGRALTDVQEKVEIDGIIYVGNHGLEIRGNQAFKLEVPVTSTTKQILKQIKKGLGASVRHIPGAWVEDKEKTLALHFRLVDRQNVSELKKRFNKICFPYLQTYQIKVRQEKKVLEVRPPIDWDKGKAVVWILRKMKLYSSQKKTKTIFYLGDDKTDEDAFKVLRERKDSVTVCVGKRKKTFARYYIKAEWEVPRLLRNILQIRAEESHVSTHRG